MYYIVCGCLYDEIKLAKNSVMNSLNEKSGRTFKAQLI